MRPVLYHLTPPEQAALQFYTPEFCDELMSVLLILVNLLV